MTSIRKYFNHRNITYSRTDYFMIAVEERKFSDSFILPGLEYHIKKVTKDCDHFRAK